MSDKEKRLKHARESKTVYPTKLKGDNVNHPTHYETGKFECIDVMLETQGKQAVQDFCICNAFKYLYRHKNKNGVEDIRKAKWYIDKYIELENTEDTDEFRIEAEVLKDYHDKFLAAIDEAERNKQITKGDKHDGDFREDKGSSTGNEIECK